jgi:hypothetical protein
MWVSQLTQNIQLMVGIREHRLLVIFALWRVKLLAGKKSKRDSSHPAPDFAVRRRYDSEIRQRQLLMSCNRTKRLL